MYPTALGNNSAVAEDVAVVLVGNGTPVTIDYLQFGHSNLPAINARGISISPGSIGAVPIPVGIKKLSLGTYTVAGRGAGYLPNGMNYGYNSVRTPPIDIRFRGVYYVATILPDPAMLRTFARNHPKIAKLKAINFSWLK